MGFSLHRAPHSCFLPSSDYVIDDKVAVLQKRDHEGFGFVLRGAKGKGGGIPMCKLLTLVSAAVPEWPPCLSPLASLHSLLPCPVPCLTIPLPPVSPASPLSPSSPCYPPHLTYPTPFLALCFPAPLLGLSLQVLLAPISSMARGVWLQGLALPVRVTLPSWDASVGTCLAYRGGGG